MELITNILIEYLKHNKRIVVPKLGAFIVKQPSGIIIFSDLMRNDDGVLRSLLMAYGTKEIEANGMIDRFVFDIHHAISRGEIFSINGFGDFSSGENNTIIFKHKREPMVFGGNIKPPVEALTSEKLKLQRIVESQTVARRSAAATKRTSTSSRTKSSREEEDLLTLGKPDAYLRGLKYDKNKNKKRSEERSEAKRSNVPSLVVILIIAIISGVAVWYGWQWLNTDKEQGDVVEQLPVREIVDDIVVADSLATDSLTIATPDGTAIVMDGRDTTIFSHNNRVTL